MDQPTVQRTKSIRKHRPKRIQSQQLGDLSRVPPKQLFDVSREVIVEETHCEEPLSSADKESKREKRHRSLSNSKASGDMAKPSVEDTNPLNSEPPAASSELLPPYEFLMSKNSPIHTVIVPHFTWKSLTFWLTTLMTLASVTLFIVYACITKKPVSWSCLLFSTQSKFFPRLRYDYELWRIVISSIFHGNISHFVLNIVGLQLYGYFVEWYYGKWRYSVAVALTVINSHLMSCLTDSSNVSSTASGILYALLGMKAVFFFKYRKYQAMGERRIPLYGLLVLIAGINLIVLFIGSNVDYGSHVSTNQFIVGGLITGLLCGLMFYHPATPTCRTKALKYTAIAITTLFSIALVLGCFLTDSPFYQDLNSAITNLC